MASKQYAHDKRVEKRAQAAILKELAKLGGRVHNDDDITFEGDKLIVPTTMTITTARKFLEKKEAELEKETQYQRIFNYRPWDGAWCMWNVLKRTFGVVGHEPTPGFFGPEPPQMITINTDVEETAQVPWGTFSLPILPGVTFQSHQVPNPEYGVLYAMTATGPKKFAAEIQGIFLLVEDELEKNSLYRGKAFDGQTMPEFIDLSGVTPEKVVYSQDVLTQLEVNVWAQLRHTEVFQSQGIPLKRAVLVYGPYGTGKTLAAILTGQEAIANGWTFIKGRPGRDDLGVVMQTARLYQPAVVFYEDVDQIADGATSSEYSISRLLDDFDGIEAKNTRILCVLTTNHVDRIHKGMARPGRLDAMIEIDELDIFGIEKLVKSCVGDKLDGDIDWAAVFEVCQGFKPAFVTEFAHRAIRYALLRNGGTAEGVTLVTDDIINAARGLRPQLQLMEAAKDRHEQPLLEAALGAVVENTVRNTLYEDYVVPRDEVER